VRRKQVVAIFVANIVVSAFVGWLTSAWVVRRNTVRQSVAAHEFLLLDNGGHAAAKLGWDGSQPGMRLYDTAGHLREALFLEPNGVPDLYLYAQNQVARASLDLFDSGVPNLAFGDAQQQHTVLLELDKDGAYNITFQKSVNGKLQLLGTRRIIADTSGVHESDTLEERSAH